MVHKDYSVAGTDIQVEIFDNRIVIKNPGAPPYPVQSIKIKSVHFSRNPKIMDFFKDYKYVKEIGEGVNRIYQEMAVAGLPEPEYRVDSFATTVTIKNM